MNHIAPITSPKPRACYVYEKRCKFCGRQFESKRHDAMQCKWCKWKRRAAAYKARHPERVLEQHRNWNAAHMDRRRAHKIASYYRHLEKNRERNRGYCAGRRQQKAMKPWELEVARNIQQIAMV